MNRYEQALNRLTPRQRYLIKLRAYHLAQSIRRDERWDAKQAHKFELEMREALAELELGMTGIIDTDSFWD